MPDTTFVTFLLDRSGSMGACKEATIEGFNAYLTGLKDEQAFAILFTFLQFDTQSLDKLCVAIPVSDVHPLSNESYQPRGGTPLIDACVKTIRAVEAAIAGRDDKPKVVICFQTDGEENSSREHSWEELRTLVTQKTAEGWQFNFMGAGIDGYVQAAAMGIGAMNTMSYDSTSTHATRKGFAASAANTRAYATGQSMNTNYTIGQREEAGDVYAASHITPNTAVVNTGALDLTTPTTGLIPGAPLAANSASTGRTKSPRQIIPNFKL